MYTQDYRQTLIFMYFANPSTIDEIWHKANFFGGVQHLVYFSQFELMVGWVLWHINLCRSFNAKSIFMQIVSSFSNNSV